MPSPATTAPAIGSASANPVGRPLDRVDGRAKVTGRATYAAEAPVRGTAHAVAVGSTIASGSVRSIDTAAAERLPGVLAVLTSANLPTLQKPNDFLPAEDRMPLSDAAVHYAGQFVAVVVAETVEQARGAAALLKIVYDEKPPTLRLDDPSAREVRPKQNMGEEVQIDRGDYDAALAAAPAVVVRQTYTVPTETHNPLEMSGTVAAWDANGRLTVWNATQGVVSSRDHLAGAFGLKPGDVRVLCPFVGGGFGCKGSAWPHTTLAAAAAKVVGRPVKLVLTRRQMFTNTGHRPQLSQAMTLAASADGKLVALGHETTVAGSALSPFLEPCGLGTSRILYAVPNLRVTHTVRQVNVAPPTFMRAPGESPGMFALESALDELAEQLKMDPVELRLANHADKHPQTGQPWSSKHLRECYTMAAERFGWGKRDPKPRSMRSADGKLLIGYGMAGATYPGYRFPATARLRLYADAAGVRAIGAAATQDLGTGAYTVFTQVTAALTGLPLDRAKFELGDSDLPPAFVSGGSSTTASVAQALADASLALRTALLKLAGDGSPLAGRKANEVELAGDRLIASADPARSESIPALISRTGRAYVEGVSSQLGIDNQQHVNSQSNSGGEDYNGNQRKFAFQSFGCHFVEVAIDPLLPRVRVQRVVSAMDVGRVVNPKTSRSQVLGGVTMGIGMALMEETIYDPRTGRPVTDSLADYPVCVNADVHGIEPMFTDVPDTHFNAVGCRGVGEIGITGVAAAVANAVYHATGKRVRDLPITPDKLL